MNEEGFILGNNDKNLYIKDIDTANHKLEFTEDPNEAKMYEGGWYADVALDFIKFHFKNEEKVKALRSMYYERE